MPKGSDTQSWTLRTWSTRICQMHELSYDTSGRDLSSELMSKQVQFLREEMVKNRNLSWITSIQLYKLVMGKGCNLQNFLQDVRRAEA